MTTAQEVALKRKVRSMMGGAKNAGEQVGDRFIGAHSSWQMRQASPFGLFAGPWIVTSRHDVTVDEYGSLPVVRVRCGSMGPSKYIVREHFLKSFYFISWHGYGAKELVEHRFWTKAEAKALTNQIEWDAP